MRCLWLCCALLSIDCVFDFLNKKKILHRVRLKRFNRHIWLRFTLCSPFAHCGSDHRDMDRQTRLRRSCVGEFYGVSMLTNEWSFICGLNEQSVAFSKPMDTLFVFPLPRTEKIIQKWLRLMPLFVYSCTRYVGAHHTYIVDSGQRLRLQNILTLLNDRRNRNRMPKRLYRLSVCVPTTREFG